MEYGADVRPLEARALVCKNLKVGDKVRTDFSGRFTEHTITERDTWKPSQSGVLFKVYPRVPKSSGSWIDSGWFEPVESQTGALPA